MMKELKTILKEIEQQEKLIHESINLQQKDLLDLVFMPCFLKCATTLSKETYFIKSHDKAEDYICIAIYRRYEGMRGEGRIERLTFSVFYITTGTNPEDVDLVISFGKAAQIFSILKGHLVVELHRIEDAYKNMLDGLRKDKAETQNKLYRHGNKDKKTT